MMVSFLEDFGVIALPTASDDESSAQAEESRLAIFEEGYAAGWEDAIKAQAEHTKVATEAFANRIEDLSFTYHEACAHLTAQLGPFLSALAAQLVPCALEQSLVGFVSERLTAAAHELPELEVQILCAPIRHQLLCDSLPPISTLPLTVKSDDTLHPDQVRLSFADREDQIDLSAVSEEIGAAIAAFTFQKKKDLANG